MNRVWKCSLCVVSMMILMGAAAVGAEKAPVKAAGKKTSGVSSKKSTKKPEAKPQAEVKPEITDAAHTLWALRDQFTFKQDDGCIDYSADNADWRVRVKDPSAPASEDVSGTAPEFTRVVAESAGFSITLSDGRVVKSADLGLGKETHDLADNGALGAGYHYDVVFPASQGVRITHRLSTLQNWPFLLFTLIIENQGTQPLDIAEVQPVLLGADALHDWSKETQLANRHGYACAGRLVYGAEKPSTLALLSDPVRHASLALATPVADLGAGEVSFTPSPGGWQGTVKFKFEPALRIAPGGKAPLDPVWISYGLGNPAKVGRYWGWAQFSMSKAGAAQIVPRAWLATGPDAGLDKLLAEAASAKSAGVTHTLIGADWEEAPGAMRGKSPAYPKNIGGAADSIRKAGLTPGITLDPLCVEAKGKPADAFVSGETAWLNPASPEGTAQVTARVKNLIGKGFEFLAVCPSDIPNEALSKFGMSRSAANAMAMALVAQAAPECLVTAAADSELPAERDAWLEAAADAANGSLYGLVPSPIRLSIAGVSKLSDEQCAALQLYPGPIELSAAPQGSADHGLAWALGGGVLQACPLDLGATAPRVWQQRAGQPAAEGGPVPVLGFAGAPAWPLNDLLDPLGDGAVAGCLRQNGFEVTDGGKLPASTELSLYAVFRPGATPSFLTASDHGGPGAPAKTQWDSARNVLHGAFPHALGEGAVAYVYVPEGWKPKSATAGKNSAKFTMEGRVMALHFEGTAAEFEVKFDKP